MIKTALIFLALWCLGLTICLGFIVHELMQTKEQAVVAQGVSSRANEQTDKWGMDYYFHMKFYHTKEEMKDESAKQ